MIEHGYRWHELAEYNSERARGLVHTPEWVARMVIEQAMFDAEHEDAAREAGGIPVEGGGWLVMVEDATDRLESIAEGFRLAAMATAAETREALEREQRVSRVETEQWRRPDGWFGGPIDEPADRLEPYWSLPWWRRMFKRAPR